MIGIVSIYVRAAGPGRLLGLVALALLAPTAVLSGDWPQFHYSEARTGFNAAEARLGTANANMMFPKWRTTISAAPVSPPVVANGMVFVGSNDGGVYALAEASGQILWRGSTGASVPFSPAVAQGLVFAGSDDTKVYAFPENCSTPCSPTWTATTAGRISTAPAVSSGVVYIGAGRGADGDLWALDAATGTAIWVAPLPSAPQGVAVADGHVYADNYAFPVSCSTPCSPVWIGNNGGRAIPAVADGLVFVNAGSVNWFNAYPTSCTPSCSPRWVATTETGTSTVAAIALGLAYLQQSTVLSAFPERCSTPCAAKWSAALLPTSTSPATANGVVYVGSSSDQLLMFDAATGADLWAVDTGDPASSPAIANGTVYVSTFRGILSTDLGKVSAFTVPVWYVSPAGNDANDCLGPGSACATIQAAAAKATAGGTLEVATGTYTSTGPEVISLDKPLVLLGGWNASFTTRDGLAAVDGESSRRGLTVQSGVTATVERFVFENGAPVALGGGGIYNGGTLTLDHCAVRGNSGSGIYNLGTLTIAESTISGNSSGSDGGGIRNLSGALTVNSSTVSGNGSTGYGGGIHNGSGALTILDSTITANTAASGGGGLANRTTATVTLSNSIVAGNAAPSGTDCWRDATAAINSRGHNLIGSTTDCSYVPGTGDLVDANPVLGPLQDNGGVTVTHALLPASPAIDAGDDADCPFADQRGVPRPQGVACDIGAFELPPLATSFYTVPPCRVADTRSAEGPALVAGASRTFPVAGRCGVPSDAVAAAVSVTTVSQTSAGNLRLYKAGAQVPTASTINFRPNQARANNSVVPLGVGGQIGVYCAMAAGGTTHFVLDLVGYFK